MTIKNAIELLEELCDYCASRDYYDDVQALNMAIDALKAKEEDSDEQ